MWLPLEHPPPGTWPATQACALTGNRTGYPLVCRPALNPLSHTSQGWLPCLLIGAFNLFMFKIIYFALSGVAQWIECWPANQRVTSLIPSHDTCLGCGPGPWWGSLERQPHIDVSLPLFLPPYSSLKINKILKKNNGEWRC